MHGLKQNGEGLPPAQIEAKLHWQVQKIEYKKRSRKSDAKNKLNRSNHIKHIRAKK